VSIANICPGDLDPLVVTDLKGTDLVAFETVIG
jgi:hypothetical protein